MKAKRGCWSVLSVRQYESFISKINERTETKCDIHRLHYDLYSRFILAYIIHLKPQTQRNKDQQDALFSLNLFQ